MTHRRTGRKDNVMDEELKKLIDIMKLTRVAILEFENTTKGYRKEIKCPGCEDGIVRYSISSSNGHISAKCSTKDCVSWIE